MESRDGVILNVDALRLRRGTREVLRGVSLRVHRGELVALMGLSGGGKTTVLRSVAALEPFDAGTIDVDGVVLRAGPLPPRNVAKELRKRVGMVFQRPNPMPISVYDNVLFGLRIHTPPKELKKMVLDEIVEQALTEVGLWNDLKDRLDTKATTLQLEQQQKLCIARLLPLKPEIILMDEPCSALDVEATGHIEELMMTLKGRYTIVIVTHNMAQARRASDECIFMLMGELVEHSRTTDLFITPKNPKTAEYIEGRYG